MRGGSGACLKLNSPVWSWRRALVLLAVLAGTVAFEPVPKVYALLGLILGIPFAAIGGRAKGTIPEQARTRPPNVPRWCLGGVVATRVHFPSGVLSLEDLSRTILKVV